MDKYDLKQYNDPRKSKGSISQVDHNQQEGGGEEIVQKRRRSKQTEEKKQEVWKLIPTQDNLKKCNQKTYRKRNWR